MSVFYFCFPLRVLYCPGLHLGLTATKRIKCLWINLPKEAKDMHAENYKILMKVRWHKHMERYTMFLHYKNQYCENWLYYQNNLQIQWNPYQITNGIFHRIRTNIFTICVEIQKTWNVQSNLEKKKQSGEIRFLTSDYTTKL